MTTPIPTREGTAQDAPADRTTPRRLAVRRNVITWTAVLAGIAATAALAVATLTGNHDSAEVPALELEESVTGSDQHLINLAEELKRQAELQQSVTGSDQHLVNLAEELEQRARLADAPAVGNPPNNGTAVDLNSSSTTAREHPTDGASS